MTATKEQKEKALEIAKKQKINAVWVNEKGEFFTTENYAMLSVGNKKDKVAKIENK
ncbi:MAG: hypothetical protein LBN95_06015 [Prevotellaceae bacterium]|jgi:hypothetical protein|nr:hypothetical protein [Prevotellaceae bacterium]